ncbi:hypothetical protein K466DRAFT_593594 [Polyporus arcularius HHB13444]|uniref:Uncharacterized protein n=1 Tax=Polyporus arcularius HHB13444 TaxID=1314778 RepID=A0A5C3Q053_9APHY|nr:hypothetical protein K466DRAFT_593594 [Polyporus arcularius HHB13444]
MSLSGDEDSERARILRSVSRDVLNDFWDECIRSSMLAELFPDSFTVEKAHEWLDRARSPSAPLTTTFAQLLLRLSVAVDVLSSHDFFAVFPLLHRLSLSVVSAALSLFYAIHFHSLIPSISLLLSSIHAVGTPLHLPITMAPRDDILPHLLILTSTLNARKRLRLHLRGADGLSSGSESDNASGANQGRTSTASKRARKKAKQSQLNGHDDRIQISRETYCSKLVDLEKPPRCWNVPRPEGVDSNIAYRLDLSRDEATKWTTNDGKAMSMLAVIKREDQDAWGGGSAGSLQKTVTVHCLDDDDSSGGVECQQATHVCQGIYHCPHLLPSLLEDCERYEANLEEVAALSALRGVQNAAQRTEVEASALTFYNMVQDNHKCGYKDKNSTLCTGKPTLRLGKHVTFNGKNYWVGCSGWHASHPDRGRAHRHWTIPSDVDEDILSMLFKTGGILPEDADAPLEGKTSYSHCVDGKAEKPKLVLRKCPARLQVWYPVDRSDRRAIVMLKGPHNHPTPQHGKPGLESSRRYAEAVKAAGAYGATPVRVDGAPSTRLIFDGQAPAAADCALTERRQKSEIIRKVKQQLMPHGTGIEAVLARYKQDLSKPVSERYIHDFSIVDEVPVITTFVPGLAEHLHKARVLLHDNTYKRIAGKEWIEWETVTWLDHIDMRVTIARSYCSRERRQDFRRIIESFYKAVERVTGRPIRLKAFSGPGNGGILAVLVDCCQAQMDALGDFFLKYNKPSVSGIRENNPQKLVEYVGKICGVHYDRNVTELSRKCECPETIARVRALPNLRTREELDDFISFCENSHEKGLRDWYANKKGMPWFWAVINRHFSKMPERDWLSTPDNTNINESAHTLTNAHTGTGLSIFEGILRAEEFDRQQLMTIQSTEASGVRHNRHNTPAKRMLANATRQASRNARSLANSDAQKLKNSKRAGKGKVQSHPYDDAFNLEDGHTSSTQAVRYSAQEAFLQPHSAVPGPGTGMYFDMHEPVPDLQSTAHSLSAPFVNPQPSTVLPQTAWPMPGQPSTPMASGPSQSLAGADFMPHMLFSVDYDPLQAAMGHVYANNDALRVQGWHSDVNLAGGPSVQGYVGDGSINLGYMPVMDGLLQYELEENH